MRRIIFTLLVILGYCANTSGPIWASEANPGVSVGYQSPESEKFNTPDLQVATVNFTKPPFNGVVRVPTDNLKLTPWHRGYVLPHAGGFEDFRMAASLCDSECRPQKKKNFEVLAKDKQQGCENGRGDPGCEWWLGILYQGCIRECNGTDWYSKVRAPPTKCKDWRNCR